MVWGKALCEALETQRGVSHSFSLQGIYSLAFVNINARWCKRVYAHDECYRVLKWGQEFRGEFPLSVMRPWQRLRTSRVLSCVYLLDHSSFRAKDLTEMMQVELTLISCLWTHRLVFLFNVCFLLQILFPPSWPIWAFLRLRLKCSWLSFMWSDHSHWELTLTFVFQCHWEGIERDRK